MPEIAREKSPLLQYNTKGCSRQSMLLAALYAYYHFSFGFCYILPNYLFGFYHILPNYLFGK